MQGQRTWWWGTHHLERTHLQDKPTNSQYTSLLCHISRPETAGTLVKLAQTYTGPCSTDCSPGRIRRPRGTYKC